jgi:hypothetical protein
MNEQRCTYQAHLEVLLLELLDFEDKLAPSCWLCHVGAAAALLTAAADTSGKHAGMASATLSHLSIGSVYRYTRVEV